MLFFKRNKKIDYTSIIPILEKGDALEIQNLLWQPKRRKIEYLPITFTMIQKLKKDESFNGKLNILQIIEHGNFELVIFNLPWDATDLPYSPLIFDKRVHKIVGIMLPFNDLHPYLTNSDNKAIGDLGVKWVRFTFSIRS